MNHQFDYRGDAPGDEKVITVFVVTRGIAFRTPVSIFF